VPKDRLRRCIGVFGGTFDPVHRGHLEAADEVRRRLAISDFRMIPARDPPHRGATGASAGHRLAMLECARRDYPELGIDRRELDRPGPSWMVDTLASLRAEYRDASLLLIIGQDAANRLAEWHRWRELFELAHVVVVSRPGELAAYPPELEQELTGRWVADPGELHRAPAGLACRVEVPEVAVSASGIRRGLGAGEAVDRWLPSGVMDYIREHGLYGVKREA